MKAKKILLSALFIAVFGVYVVYTKANVNINNPLLNNNNSASSQPTSQNIAQTIPQNRGEDDSESGVAPISQNIAVTTPTKKVTQNPPQTGKYKNGTYTGQSADAFYGLVQVQAVISGGKLTDVKFLDYPKDRQHSLDLSNYALPRLKQEAIQAQSSNVNAVSGATDTSAAFVQSLSSALSQAI